MVSISIWVFRTKEEAVAQAENQKNKKRKVCGPIELGTVDIVCRCAEPGDEGKYFRNLKDKWGIVVISYTDQ